MTETSGEKLIAELSEEMAKKRYELVSGNIPSLHEFIDRALVLHAALQDVRASTDGRVPNSAYALQQVRSSGDALREYRRGKDDAIGGQPSSMREQFTGSIATILSGDERYRSTVYLPVLKYLCGQESKASKRRSLESLQEDLVRSEISHDFLRLFWGDRLREAAFALLEVVLRQLLTPDLKMSAGNSPEAFWRLKLAGIDANGSHTTEGIEFLHGFTDRLDGITQAHAHELYHGRWQRALGLWRNLSKLSETTPVTRTVKRTRSDIARALAEKNCDEAERLFAALKNPVRRPVQHEREHGSLKERSEHMLAELIPYEGALFQIGGKTREKEVIQIIAVRPDILRDRIGTAFGPGVHIAYLQKERGNPSSGKMVIAREQILSPSEVRRNIRSGRWTLINE